MIGHSVSLSDLDSWGFLLKPFHRIPVGQPVKRDRIWVLFMVHLVGYKPGWNILEKGPRLGRSCRVQVVARKRTCNWAYPACKSKPNFPVSRTQNPNLVSVARCWMAMVFFFFSPVVFWEVRVLESMKSPWIFWRFRLCYQAEQAIPKLICPVKNLCIRSFSQFNGQIFSVTL